jgi:predicted aspartyl protease
MIVGIVRGREPLIRLTIRGLRGRQQEIEAVVDSGYTGWLTLPPAVIGALNLPWRTFGRGICEFASRVIHGRRRARGATGHTTGTHSR